MTQFAILAKPGFPAISRFSSARRAGIAIIAAILIVPMIGLIGLAVDFALWNQTYAAMALAANGAAMNAVKIAADAQIAGNANYLADGSTAGKQWFAAQIGARGYTGTLSTIQPTVTVTQSSDTTLTATVTFSAEMQSVFGLLYNVLQYPLNIESDAIASTAPYLEVQILLDNSSSMEIGATPADIVAIELATMCSASGNEDPYNNQTGNFGSYTCSAGGYTDPACPLQLPTPTYPYSSVQPSLNIWGQGGGPTCKGWLGAKPNSNGTWPTAGAPCALACHSDTSHPAGSGYDSYAVVRSTAGTATPITLRFDVVKSAVNTLISSLAQYNIPSINNLSVGVWDFGLQLIRDYPIGDEAGSNWADATAAVGAQPTTPNGPDTGIQPAIFDASHQNTDFNDAMVSLSQQVTAAGKGTSPQSPRKILFIVTDGLEDYSGYRGPVDANQCTLFKDMGYTVYVVYTPYYSIPSYWYFTQAAPSVEPIGNSAVTNALQACASSPTDYIAATDQASLTAALLTFLRSALVAPARFTK
jgi:hypothetical protein